MRIHKYDMFLKNNTKELKAKGSFPVENKDAVVEILPEFKFQHQQEHERPKAPRI